MYLMNSDIKKAILFGQYCILSLDKKHRLYIINTIVFNEKCEKVGYFVNNNLLVLEGLPILRCGYVDTYSKKGYNESVNDELKIKEYIKKINEKIEICIFTEIDEFYITRNVNEMSSMKSIDQLWD